MAPFSDKLKITYLPQEKLCTFTGLSDLRPTNIQQIQRTLKDKKPFLPGSSIKGVIRRNAERIAELLGFKACYKKAPENISKEHDEIGGLCDICKIFGCPNHSSKIQVTDAISSLENSPASIYTGIRIDNDAGTTSSEALFQYEALARGVPFHGTIYFRNLTENEFKLLICSLQELTMTGIGRYGGLLSVKITNISELPSPLQKIVREVFQIV
ncbi:MAG: RAMP superfamily CRISPR-associated protein [Candidatus Helarchaeota archaeon]